MNTDSLTAEEIAELRTLLEVEKIRKKKNQYSHRFDSLDAEGFADLYTEDAIGEWGPFGRHEGRDAIRAAVAGAMEGQPLYAWLHMTTNLWIELTGEDTAASRCYLHDVLTIPHARNAPTAWFGIYEEDWVKQDGTWKIRRHRIFFLWPTREVEGDDFASHMVSGAIG
jgi:hypothetical protein